ncbi:MAG: DoxX family protein [Bacteroidetes bacterium]|nr:DoxX family protein [Bacteroidota bacterium]
MFRNLFSIRAFSQSANITLFVGRVALALFMLSHGLGKAGKLLGNELIKFGDPIGLGQELSLFLAVFAEVICSVLLLLGLATRAALIPLMFTMGVAAFVVHAGDDFGSKELPLMYLLAYLLIFIFGAGKYSLDYLIGKGK